MRKPKPCPACGCHYGASTITALRNKIAKLEKDVQVAKGQYEGACIIVKQLEEKVAELQANLSHFQESEFHPDWSLLKATRESLLEHQGLCRMLQAKLDEAANQEPVGYVRPTIEKTLAEYGNGTITKEPTVSDAIKLYAEPINLPALIEQAKADEREECAQICDDYSANFGSGMFDKGASDCADAIRARKP